MKRWNLYVVVSSELTCGRSVLEVVEHALDGGAEAVQMREKSLNGRELVNLAAEIRKVTYKYNADFIVNDRVDIAFAVGADGIHLGQEDIPVEYARKIIGDKIIGVSATNLEEAAKAEKDGADYIGVGPIFKTGSKEDAAVAMGLDSLREARRLTNIPLVAIGGINHDNVEEVIGSGADSVAVISVVTGASNIKDAAESIRKKILLGKGRDNGRN